MALHRLLVLAAAVAALPAAAHLSYSGRNFGDSHHARAFRFHLDGTLTLEITAAANAGATASAVGGLLPGFSIYEGLVHVAPASADDDSSAISLAYLATLPGPAKEGAWVATGDWRIGNDGNAAEVVGDGLAVVGGVARRRACRA